MTRFTPSSEHPFETRKILVLSTGHLTKETAQVLENTPHDEWPCCGGPYSTYGWFIYAHDENLGIGGHKIPPDLWAVMEFAVAHKCDNILFDCDADTVDGLPTWEW